MIALRKRFVTVPAVLACCALLENSGLCAPRQGWCPPGSKNEICRCVTFKSPKEYRFKAFVPAGDPPAFCYDGRIQEGWRTATDQEFNDLVAKVMNEQGQKWPGYKFEPGIPAQESPVVESDTPISMP